jgi:hypothetical protein
MNLLVSREDSFWSVKGEAVDAQVFGSIKWGPNSVINGKGAMKYRKEILAAVEEYRNATKTPNVKAEQSTTIAEAPPTE